jgi:ketosteroid isomerase-like protein
MAANDPGTVARECLAAWTGGDVESVRGMIHDDVTFDGPLGHTEGADEYMEGLRGMARMVKGADQHRVAVDGEDAFIVYDLLTDAAPPIPTVGWYQVRDGRIASLRVYFDPRPLVGGG